VRFLPRSFRDIDVGALRDAVRIFRPALRGQRWAVAGSFVLTLLVVGLELLRPWPIKIVFDHVFGVRASTAGMWGMSPATVLTLAALAVLLISVLLAFFTLRATLSTGRVAKKMTVRIRRQVFEHLHRLALPFHQSSRSGDLLVRLMGDVNAVRDALFTSWLTLVGRGILFVGTATIMFVLEPWLALLALAPLPLLAFDVGRSSRRLREITRQQRRREGDAASFAAETLRQIRLVKAYAAEDAATDTFTRGSRSGERAGLKATRIAARIDGLTEILTGAGTAIVLFVGAHWVLAGRISAGSLLVLVSYTRSLYKPLRKASGEGARLSKASACAGRLLEVLRIPPEDQTAGDPAPEFRGDIALRDVHHTYANGVRALRGATCDLAAGTLALIEGPNGSGKSTLLSMLLRLIDPESGEVLIDGVPVSTYQLASYRRRFAYIPQDLQLFGATVRDNILYGRPDATDEEVEAAARVARFDEVAARLPDGYDTPLGEGGATLSGGEARRLMLSRAAVREARVLILDEPLAGLDPQSRAVVAQAIRGIAAGRTTIVVSHGMSAEIGPDVVLHMRDGAFAAVEPALRAVAAVEPVLRPVEWGA